MSLEAIKREGSAFWDQNPCAGVWPTYQDLMTWIQRTEPYIFNILQTMNSAGKRIVEVGCGQGTTANYLPQFGANVLGLDMSLESIQSAFAGARELRHTDKTHFLQADAERLCSGPGMRPIPSATRTGSCHDIFTPSLAEMALVLWLDSCYSSPGRL